MKEFGGAAFGQLIQHAQGFFDFYLDRLCTVNDLTGDRGRRAVVQAMTEAVQKTGSAVLLDTYAQKTALRLGVPADAVRVEFKKTRRGQRDAPEDPAEEPAVEIAQASRLESGFLRLLLENDSLVEWVAAHLELDWIVHPAVRDITAWRLRMEETQSWPGLAAWLSETDNPIWRNLITQILVDKRPLPNPETEMRGTPTRQGAVQNLRNEYIVRQLSMLHQRLESPDLTDTAKEHLLRMKSQLNRLKQQPLAPKDSPPA
jgi:DNA primase